MDLHVQRRVLERQSVPDFGEFWQNGLCLKYQNCPIGRSVNFWHISELLLGEIGRSCPFYEGKSSLKVHSANPAYFLLIFLPK